jgi:excisionase family DNA binding protein
MKLLYTTAEAAVYFTVHRQTIKNWISSGQLRGQKKGRIYLFTKVQLDKCQSQRRRPGRPKMTAKKGFYTPQEVMDKAGISRQRVSQLAKKNKWERKNGRFPVKVIDQFLANR